MELLSGSSTSPLPFSILALSNLILCSGIATIGGILWRMKSVQMCPATNDDARTACSIHEDALKEMISEVVNV